jgi:hypothetical protein
MRRLNPTGLGKKGGLHPAASRWLGAGSSKLSAPERAPTGGIQGSGDRRRLCLIRWSAGGGPSGLSVSGGQARGPRGDTRWHAWRASRREAVLAGTKPAEPLKG